MHHHTQINNIIITVCQCLTISNIPFCIAGGIAVSLWGHVRATEDIDIIALIDDNSEKKIVNTLQEHFTVIPHKEEMMQQSLTPVKRYVIIDNFFHFVVDILLATNDFLQHCIQNSKLFSMYGITIPVISLEDLIVIKCAAGRHQDIADVVALLSGSFSVNNDYIIKKLEIMHISLPEEVKHIILQ